MITIKTPPELKLMKKAGRIVADTLNYLANHIQVGLTTKQLDELAYEYIIKQGALPSFKGYQGFPKTICTSINEEIVHGIPNDYKLQEGDIISIDIGACYQGYHADSAYTYPVGKIDKDKAYLLKHTKEALYIGLSQIKEGIHLGTVSHAIGHYATQHNLSIFKELVGHGIGQNLHEAPDIFNYGRKNTGPLLKSGMTLAIEPMLGLGSDKIIMSDNNWTISTLDKTPSAHFEHTILVTKEGYEILTGE